MIIETEHPRFGTVRQVRSAVRIGDAVPEYRRAPQLNEDYEYVLRDVLHYDTERIAGIGSAPTNNNSNAEETS
jgi:crotonobetainyl-CoA:carnitine CoA-transferase CaiB-like acyl-CoA transferase